MNKQLWVSVIVKMIISYDNDIESCKGYTTFFAVRGVFRGNKIAGMLLERACSHAKAQGMHVMGLQTYNEIAKKCYMKNEFIVKESVFVEKYNFT